MKTKRNLSISLMGAITFLLISHTLTAQDWSEKIQLYGHGFSVPTDFTDDEFEYLANTYKIFTVEKRHAYNSYGGNPSSERATIGTAAKLKALNPDIKVLLYWNSVMNYKGLYEYNAEFDAHPEWVHSIWPTGYEIYDLENIDCQDWFVNSVCEIIEDGDLDGVFFDAGPKAYVSGLSEALFTAKDRVRARIGDDKIIIYNGYRVPNSSTIQAGPEFIEHASGVFIEFFLHSPLDTKEEAALLFDNLIDAYEDGKMIVPRGTPSSFLPGTEDPFHFTFASFLLFYGANTYWIYNEGYNKTEGMFDYYPEYYDKATGQSLGSPQRNGWVYTREFENVSVRVDLLNKTSSITWIENPDDDNKIITNLALTGTATQSSTDFEGEASRANDGNSNGSYSGGSVTHTESEDNPWWQVDLGSSYSIGEISVFGRTDECCKARLTDFTVYVLDEDSTVIFSNAYTTYPDPSVTMNAGGLEGRYIKVQMNGTGTLSLAEVKVFDVPTLENQYTVSLKITDDTTNDSITVASLDINDKTYTSNYVGELTLKLDEGTYPFTLSKEGYDTLNHTLNITKDTALVLQMTAIPQYTLSYKITDDSTGVNLPEVELTIDGKDYTTDELGEVSLKLYGDEYEYTLSKTGYHSINQSISIAKDTLVVLQMGKESYKLGLQVNDAETEAYMSDVSFTINDSVYKTDALGSLSLILDFGEYDYTLIKTGYLSLNQIINLTKDTVVALQIEKESFSLVFQVKDATTDENIQDVLISINDSVYETDALGSHSLVQDYGDYNYTISKDDYDGGSGSLSLRKDTTLTILMSLITGVNSPIAYEIEIYPNPVNDALNILLVHEERAKCEIFNIAGELIHSDYIVKGENLIEVGDFIPGIYLVKIAANNQHIAREIVKK